MSSHGGVREYFRRTMKVLTQIHDEPKDRTVPLGDSSSLMHVFGDNHLKTSKYTMVNFFPLSLFMQFRKAGNVYFLCMSMLMLLGMYTDVFQTPITAYTTLVPLSIVLAISMGQEALADSRRHRADKEVNNRRAVVIESNNGGIAATKNSERSGEASVRTLSVAQRGFVERSSQAARQLHDREPDESPIYRNRPQDDPPRRRRRGRRVILWQDIVAGDLVVVRNHEQIPSDLVLLASSDKDALAYVETSSIDGETNLKLRSSAIPPRYRPRVPEDGRVRSAPVLQFMRELQGNITCEPPNICVNSFTGKLTLKSTLNSNQKQRAKGIGAGSDGPKDDAEASFPLDVENIMLRGSVLRNTQWAIGCAVYTGKDTKFAQNTSHPPAKLSRVDTAVNNAIKVIFFVDLALVTASTLLLINFEERNFGGLYYLGYWDDDKSDPAVRAYVDERYPNMEWQDETSTFISGWLTFLVLFNNFIPLSMYVTLEIVTFIQLSFVNTDVEMYDETTDTPARARSNNVTDLGMIQYIFSDKTGTLTQNIMRFQLCSVAGSVYGTLPGGRSMEKDATSWDEESGTLQVQEKTEETDQYVRRSSHSLEALARQGHVDEMGKGKAAASIAASDVKKEDGAFLALQTLRIMALCNTVVVEDVKNGSDMGGADVMDATRSVKAEDAEYGYLYQAESPDEGALVSAARDHGMVLRGRSDGIVPLQLRQGWETAQDAGGINETKAADEGGVEKKDAPTVQQDWELLAVNKFDADRKRMSVVVREPAALGGRVILLMKGADNKMLDVCREPGLSHVSEMEKHLVSFAKEGLRTLVLGYRFVPEDEYAAWAERYSAATKAMDGRNEALRAAALEIERDVLVAGATAIEDRLQDEVPETIASLAPAGVKLWVLTGDKRETAENIGYSARVLRPGMDLRVLRDASPAEIHQQIKSLYEEIIQKPGDDDNKGGVGGAGGEKGGLFWLSPQAAEERRRDRIIMERLEKIRVENKSGPGKLNRRSSNVSVIMETVESGSLALVLEGPALLHVLNDPALELALFRVLDKCTAVIACRVSPKQKALLVRTVKKCISPTPVTLGIGDGANDVAMLQEAQVGIGISGREGQQAVNSSDFAISQFKFLKPLLMVHGRWSYRRQAKVVLYSFYKNLVLVVTLFLYALFSGFSGTAAYEDMLISGFNLFLGMPIIMTGIFDRDVTREYALKNTWLYVSGRTNRDLNVQQVAKWIMQALFHGNVIFWLAYYSYFGAADAQGRWTWGTIAYSAMVQALQVKVLAETNTFLIQQYPVCTKSEIVELRRQEKLRCLGVCEEPCCSRWSWTWFFWFGSILFFFSFAFIYSDFPDELYEDLPVNASFEHVPHVALALPLHWLLFILIPMTILVIDLVPRAISRFWLPVHDEVQAGIEHCRLKEHGWDDWEGGDIGFGLCSLGSKKTAVKPAPMSDR
eukprot:CAMPEP_0118850950 /NCGR_PEP_ID=MMETSP1163-20130328/572_1 /TAXON_ID=124430 /ORGANISM="Phaeomonas parva, Strain CCMP2877" /LENGTH=1437 /DNA_ID=CAMNT_0006783195 /DNA_START=226 /DNA_END=4539 /DNA_ORIENTATION=+